MSWLQILTGDCRDILPTLAAGSVQCCVTSPPYWGLRDYGTAQWEGGEAGCDHLEPNIGYRQDGARGNRAGDMDTAFHGSPRSNLAEKPYKHECAKCGARRIDSQLGLEATPEEYIANLVGVFRAVWRVLRDDGTCWINLGDTYASGDVGKSKWTHELGAAAHVNGRQVNKIQTGLKPKDLCMMPARLAMALQADGWYLRSDIIWHKPNPMPESVTDRPTKAHEYIFLLTKSERYFYDAEAIRENKSDSTFDRDKYARLRNSTKGFEAGIYHSNDGMPSHFGDMGTDSISRNKRSVWTIATQPYAEAHFATFPEEIPKLCILAGSRPGDLILDPFAGSGTTGQVALELGRKAILIELNSAYIELAEDRTFVTPGFL
jgi:DNA modification methylase